MREKKGSKEGRDEDVGIHMAWPVSSGATMLPSSPTSPQSDTALPLPPRHEHEMLEIKKPCSRSFSHLVTYSVGGGSLV